jgi:hypothetical protein
MKMAESLLLKGWYYDLEDTAEELGTVIAQGTQFSITINTKGEEGELKDYGFAVEVTDNSNQTVSSVDTLAAGSVPTLQVKNGPNDTPVAAFAVDRTSVMVGEEVVFSSTAFDPDGKNRQLLVGFGRRWFFSIMKRKKRLH